MVGAAGCLRLDGNDASPTVEETFVTSEKGENIDQPAVWHGDDAHLLLVTAKSSHELDVFDAATGEYLDSIGNEGAGVVEFDRPNGLYVIDDLAVVVERDNARAQLLRLPEGEPLGTFGEDRLRKPYEGMVFDGPEGYEIYITDDYDASELSELDERVKRYRFTISDDGVDAEHVNSFGATEEPGALHAVESIYADPEHDRLMIADEDDYSMKLYDLGGDFLEVVTDVFDEGNDPEGIALYENDGSGYWVFTEQAGHDDSLLFERDRSRFHVFDRESLEHVATFRGEETANTDGVWLTQTAFGPFPSGAFYAVHDDRTVSAFDLAEIAKATGID